MPFNNNLNESLIAGNHEVNSNSNSTNNLNLALNIIAYTDADLNAANQDGYAIDDNHDVDSDDENSDDANANPRLGCLFAMLCFVVYSLPALLPNTINYLVEDDEDAAFIVLGGLIMLLAETVAKYAYNRAQPFNPKNADKFAMKTLGLTVIEDLAMHIMIMQDALNPYRRVIPVALVGSGALLTSFGVFTYNCCHHNRVDGLNANALSRNDRITVMDDDYVLGDSANDNASLSYDGPSA